MMDGFKSVRAEPFTRDQEEQATLALVPLAKEIADFVRDRIPAGTDFGVLLFAKPPEGQIEGRVIAVTSDRDRVAPYAAQWALSVLNPEARRLLNEKIKGESR